MKQHPAVAVTCQATQQYQTAHQAVLEHWSERIPCQHPGSEPQCLQCPYFGLYIQRLQQELWIEANENEDTQPGYLEWSKPKITQPYSPETQAQIVVLYKEGLSISQIGELTGIAARSSIKQHLINTGLMKKLGDYTPKDKKWCLELFEQGQCLTDIEDETQIDADCIETWLTPEQRKIAKQRKFSESLQKLALDIYQAGADNQTIWQETQIDPQLVIEWANAKGIKRPIVVQHGRRGIDYHQKREEARKLKKEGYSKAKIGEILEVNADTVRRWLKKAL